MPSGDGNTLQRQVGPPASKLTASATGRAAHEGFRQAVATLIFPRWGTLEISSLAAGTLSVPAMGGQGGNRDVVTINGREDNLEFIGLISPLLEKIIKN